MKKRTCYKLGLCSCGNINSPFYISTPLPGLQNEFAGTYYVVNSAPFVVMLSLDGSEKISHTDSISTLDGTGKSFKTFSPTEHNLVAPGDSAVAKRMPKNDDVKPYLDGCVENTVSSYINTSNWKPPTGDRPTLPPPPVPQKSTMLLQVANIQQPRKNTKASPPRSCSSNDATNIQPVIRPAIKPPAPPVPLRSTEEYISNGFSPSTEEMKSKHIATRIPSELLSQIKFFKMQNLKSEKQKTVRDETQYRGNVPMLDNPLMVSVSRNIGEPEMITDVKNGTMESSWEESDTE